MGVADRFFGLRLLHRDPDLAADQSACLVKPVHNSQLLNAEGKQA
jgi:hypothetical protein